MKKGNRNWQTQEHGPSDDGGVTFGTLAAGLLLAAVVVFACSWLGMAVVVVK